MHYFIPSEDMMLEQEPDARQNEQQSEPKLPYSTPRLAPHGTITQITQAATGAATDGGQGSGPA